MYGEVDLTYLTVQTNFTRLCRSFTLDRSWSNHGKAYLPPAQYAAAEDARVSCADGNEMGAQDARSPSEKGT